MGKPVRLRRVAAEDLDRAVDHLLTEATAEVATRFIRAVEVALAHVGRHPHNGSLRFSYELDIPQLWAWPLTGFPYLVFFIERVDEVDAWRVLQTSRDIPAALADHRER